MGLECGFIKSCYATGAVTGTGSFTGGLVGDHYSGTITSCYFDKETTGFTDSIDDEAKTTTEMKTQGTYDDTGVSANNWDFTNTWDILSNINNGYPHLRNNLPAE